MLSRPPGCGKTLFARALASGCGIPLVTGSYSEWLSTGTGHQGDLMRAMRATFAEARGRAPAVLFLDEVDSFPNREMVTHRHREWDIQVVNGLLGEVDGAHGRPGVILVAACNHPEKLDPALVRAGRLDRHIRIRLPDRAALERILREHLGEDLGEVPLSGAALMAAGSTGADVERMVRGARRRARDADRAVVLADLVAELGGQLGDDADIWRIAVHEAGNAVASCVLVPGALRAVTLHGVARGGAVYGQMERPYLTAADVRRHLLLLLAGRAAEEVVLSEPSSGAGGGGDSDLAAATLLAVTASAALGLDGEAGLMWMGLPDAQAVPVMLSRDPALAQRVWAALENAYGEAVSLIGGRRAAVEAVARQLMSMVVLRDIDGVLTAVSAGAVAAARETEDGGTLLLLSGGRCVQVPQALAEVLGWLDGRG